MHFKDVIFAVTNLYAAMIAVRTHIWLFPCVPHVMLLQTFTISKFQLTQITLLRFFSMGRHVRLNFRLSLESLSTLFTYAGAGCA